VAGGADEQELRELQSDWERLAERDAYYAVCSHPDKAGGGWDADEFYASGRYAIDDVILPFVAEHGASMARGRALEFGCGAGRLSFALARHFDHVTGVDISAPMLERARDHGIPEPCTLLLQDSPDLPDVPPAAFDFVLSMLVIQHIPPPLGRRYLSALARRVAPGGVLLCQVPYGFARVPPGSPTGGARRAFRRLAPAPLVAQRRARAQRAGEARQRAAGEAVMELHHLPRRDVERLLRAEGLEIVHVDGDHTHETPPLVSAWYLARRP
jgi:SAM-dependent methyltransferase